MTFTPEQIQAEIERRGLNKQAPSSTFSSEQIQAEIERRGLQRPTPSTEDQPEFSHGVLRGLKSGASLVAEGVPAITKGAIADIQEAFGFEPSVSPQENLEQYQKEVEAIQKKYPTNTPSVKDIDGVGGVVDYVASSAGEALPSIATSMIGGFGGALIAKQGLQQYAKRAGLELTEDMLQKTLTKGAVVGSLVPSAPQNISETYLNLLEGGENAPMVALVTGSLKSALDIYTPTTLLGKMLGPKQASDLIADSVLKRMGIEGGKAAGSEAVTEASQQGLDILADNFVNENAELFTTDNMWSLIDSGLKGAIGGGTVGAASAPFMTPTENIKKPENDSLFDVDVSTSPLNTDVVTPTYVSNPDLRHAKQSGIDVESLAALSPEQVQDIKTPKKKKASKPIEVDDLAKRQVDVKSDTPSFNTFILGDGVINKGVKVNPKSTQGAPASKVKVQDSRKNIRFDKLQAMDNPALFELNNKDRKKKGLPPISFQRKEPLKPFEDFGFYSKLAKLYKDLPEQLSPEQMQQTLSSWKNKGLVTEEELNESGLLETLTQFTTLENKKVKKPRSFYEDLNKLNGLDLTVETTNKHLHVTLENQALGIEPVNYKEKVLSVRGIKGDDYSSHFGPGAIIQTRSSDITLPDLGNGLFVQEIQSDHFQTLEDPNFIKSGGVQQAAKFPFQKSWVRTALKKQIFDAVREGKSFIALPKGITGGAVQGHSDSRVATFYDRKVLNEAKDLAKKFGLEVSENSIRNPKADLSKGKTYDNLGWMVGPVFNRYRKIVLDSYNNYTNMSVEQKKDFFNDLPEVISDYIDRLPDQASLETDYNQAIEAFENKALAFDVIPNRFLRSTGLGGLKVKEGLFAEEVLYAFYDLSEAEQLAIKNNAKLKPYLFELQAAKEKYELFSFSIKDSLTTLKRDLNYGADDFKHFVAFELLKERVNALKRGDYSFQSRDEDFVLNLVRHQIDAPDVQIPAMLAILENGGMLIDPETQIPSYPLHILKITPDTYAKVGVAMPLFQKVESFSAYGDYYSDSIVPKQIVASLQGLEIAPEKIKNWKNIVAATKQLVREMGGPVVDVEFFDKLGVDNIYTDPVRGAQYLNTLYFALDTNTTASARIETVVHETAHFLWQNGAFTKKEKEFLLNNTDLLRQYATMDGYLSTFDFDQNFNDSTKPRNKEEYIVNAIGKRAVELLEQRDKASPLGRFLDKYVRKTQNYLRRLKAIMNGNDIFSFDDIVQSVIDGERAQDKLSDAMALMKDAQFQRMANDFKEAHNKAKEQTFKELVQEAAQEQNQKQTNTRKGMSIFGKYFRSIIDTASEHPFAGVVYDSVSRRLDNSTKYLNNYINLLGNFQSQKKDVRYRLHELGSLMRNFKKKARLDEEGHLVVDGLDADQFKQVQEALGIKTDVDLNPQQTYTFKLKNKDISTNYISLQTAYRETLHDWVNELYRAASRSFKDALGGRESSNRADFERLLLNTDKQTKPKEHERLTNLLEALDSVNNMMQSDFVPHMRFGSHGIAVKNMQGETVAFYAIEKGSFRDLFNKYQLQEVMKEIRQKYGDKSQYRVIGDKTITDYDNVDKVVPFTMSYSNLINNIDTRFLNLESLSALLYSDGMNKEAQEKLRNDLYSDILDRGFKKRFSESRNIDGFSKDWDRVTHGYLSGAAHYMSGLPHQEELSVIMTELDKLADDGPNGLKQKLTHFLQYTGTPQEDWQMMRTTNFMWTMGGNLSTALLQTVTLPTTTLATMTQYNPNIIQNMRLIGQWTKLAVQFMADTEKAVIVKDGTVAVNFGDQQKLNEMLKKGLIDLEQMQFLRKVNNYGKIRAMSTEDSLGFKPFETRSFGGSVRGKMTTLGNYLGLPISAMEQMTRFATTMASFELMQKNPEAKKRFERINAKDGRFQAQLKTRKDMNFAENAALFNMDEAHAVFGKLGRVEYQQGLSGALVFPFMTYPHQMLELITRMLGRGKDGRRGVYTFAVALMLISGLMGLPGAELLKELVEELENQWTGSEEDLDLLLREKIYDLTGDTSFAKAVTQGIGRGYLGMDISKRVGLPIPGQEIILTLMGIRGEPTNLLGVQGSLLAAMGSAWGEFNSGGGVGSVLQAVTPVAASNVLKAYNMSQEGTKTKKGIQTVLPEEITAQTILARAMGVTSDQIATGREKVYYKQLAERKFTVGVESLRNEAKNVATKMYRAQDEGDSKAVKEYQDEYSDIIDKLVAFGMKNEHRIDIASFNKSVFTGARQRTSPTLNYKDVRKSARAEVMKINKVLGVE